MKIMSVSILPDVQLESLLKSIRKVLLLKRDELSVVKDLSSFQKALVLQCHVNEFLYEETLLERNSLDRLLEKLCAVSKSKEDVCEFDLLCLASYRPTHVYSWFGKIASVFKSHEIIGKLSAEFHLEKQIIRDIPKLNPIKNDISTAVQGQYEENPYPRWINTRLERHAKKISDFVDDLDLRLVRPMDSLSDSPKILVAGCGTGQHSIGVATRFKKSSVVAVDLSASSLGYAVRKSQELNINNIKYMQADILDLKSLKIQFDLIESAGVLHHMADPMAGWGVLVDCLKTGGLMKVGLYSELARQHIAYARDIIEKRGVHPTRENIILFRKEIIEGKIEELRSLVDSYDFYSTSLVRDLLFHVQEHRFTLPKIKDALEDLGLAFVGFEFTDVNIRENFNSVNKTNDMLYDLDRWDIFEKSNPRTFNAMYQFWLQKK